MTSKNVREDIAISLYFAKEELANSFDFVNRVAALSVTQRGGIAFLVNEGIFHHLEKEGVSL